MMYEQYHTFWRRFGAAVIDFLVLLPLGFAIGVAAFFAALDEDYGALLTLSLVGTVLGLAYTVGMNGLYGATVGKKVTNIRVVDAVTDGKISWAQAFRRDSPAILSNLASFGVAFAIGWDSVDDDTYRGVSSTLRALGIVWFIAELITMMSNPRRRSLHDLLAGTVVIKTDYVPPMPAQTDYVTNPFAQAGFPQYPPPPPGSSERGW